ncbi:MAG: hypothetical protein JKX78_03695 [Alteromonadaceae bacterium]|nr:hypothetical protein [Alteromonadaceae bacterium]MBL4909056.1 hypothetical protein [Alteromonadaceae bacterium]MBL4909122.1 hypothetical protein [Alteromonadaceae bacterium]
MKRQKYPVSVINIGAVIYDVMAFTYEGKTEIDIRHWHVRSIQRKRMSRLEKRFLAMGTHPRDATQYVGLTAKNEFTWGRLGGISPRVDGWSKSISRRDRMKFTVGDDLPSGVYTTILQALKYALLDAQGDLNRWQASQAEVGSPEEWQEWEDEINDCKREIRALKTRLTKIKRGKFA